MDEEAISILNKKDNFRLFCSQ